MIEESTTIMTLTLSQQVTRINQLMDVINEEIQRDGVFIPVRVDQCMTQLRGILTRLGKQVRLHDEEKKNLRALANIGQVVNSTLELRQVLEIVLDTIIRLTGAERGFLMLRDEEDQMVTYIARDWEQESLDEDEFAISRTVINRVMGDGRAIVTTNAQEDPRFESLESIITYGLRSILCVPFKVKGEIIGVIYADNRITTGIFSDAERILLMAFADQAAVAIENARLFESVRKTLAEVTELKNLLDNVLASITSGVITLDIEDKIILCNRAAEKIVRKRSEEILGNQLGVVLPGIDQGLQDLVRDVRKYDRPIVGLETHVPLIEGGGMSLRINLSPLKDAHQTLQGVAIVLDDLTEKKNLEAKQRLFERMVSPAVIDQLNPENLQLGGKRVGITTLFADIRGYTAHSENLDPEILVCGLNRYMAAAAEAILSERGTIDKFMGDSVMAWFNAPIPQPDHAIRAIKAALRIRNVVEQIRGESPDDMRFSFGVGIHHGEAVLGLVGSEMRLEYTAIGDSVNTAKRIQENALAGQILISGEVYKLLGDKVKVQQVTPILAKGKRIPLEVYEVLSFGTIE